MHVMMVVGWESVIVAKVLNILKGSVKKLKLRTSKWAHAQCVAAYEYFKHGML